MANVSEWSANELENLYLDDMSLSDERGRRAAKIMAAVKAKEDEQDSILSAVRERQEQVNVGFVLKGTVATASVLPEDASNGDTYIVTEEDGEYYAWNGESWIDLGISDAGVVHKTGEEIIYGQKTFKNKVIIGESLTRENKSGTLNLCGGTAYYSGARVVLSGNANPASAGAFYVVACLNNSDQKTLFGDTEGSLSWDGQTIQTSSDERIKTSIQTVSDAVLDAWGEVCWGEFKFLDAVERKGASARKHLGLIAQKVKKVFDEKGLDACEYGILCHELHEETENQPTVDIWMVRYTEALAMEAAYQRRRADRIEARLDAVEAKLNGNK